MDITQVLNCIMIKLMTPHRCPTYQHKPRHQTHHFLRVLLPLVMEVRTAYSRLRFCQHHFRFSTLFTITTTPRRPSWIHLVTVLWIFLLSRTRSIRKRVVLGWELRSTDPSRAFDFHTGDQVPPPPGFSQRLLLFIYTFFRIFTGCL